MRVGPGGLKPFGVDKTPYPNSKLVLALNIVFLGVSLKCKRPLDGIGEVNKEVATGLSSVSLIVPAIMSLTSLTSSIHSKVLTNRHSDKIFERLCWAILISRVTQSKQARKRDVIV